MSFFQEPSFTPQISRTPVHLPQAVQNCTPDAKLGIRRKLNLLFLIVLVQSVDQAHHAGVHQVFKGDVPRQMLVDAARNIPHLGKLIH